MVLQVTETNITEVLNSNEITLLQFSAEWCGPCKILTPIIKELSEDNTSKTNVGIGKVNVDESGEVAKSYGVRNIPTLLLFKDGEISERMVGIVSKSDLQKKIDTLLS
jgi:thioredoxin 1